MLRTPRKRTSIPQYYPPYHDPKPPRPALPPSVADTRAYHDELDAASLGAVLGWTPSEAAEEMRRMPTALCTGGAWKVKWGDVLRQLFPKQFRYLRWQEDTQERRTPFPALEHRIEVKERRGITPYVPKDMAVSVLTDRHGLEAKNYRGITDAHVCNEV